MDSPSDKQQANVSQIVEEWLNRTPSRQRFGVAGSTDDGDDSDKKSDSSCERRAEKERRTEPKRLMVSERRPTNPFKLHALWIGNVSQSVSSEEIWQLLNRYGTIVNVKLLRASKCAIVDFDNSLSPIRAITDLYDSFQVYLAYDATRPLQLRFAASQKQLEQEAFKMLTKKDWITTMASLGECYKWRSSEGCKEVETRTFDGPRCVFGHHQQLNKNVDGYVEQTVFRLPADSDN